MADEIQIPAGDGPGRGWEPDKIDPAKEPERKKPGRPKGSGSASTVKLAEAGKATKQIGVPLTANDGIAWSALTPEKRSRVVSLFSGDPNIRSAVAGDPSSDVGPDAAAFLFNSISGGMELLARMRGFSEEAAKLMAFRAEQTDPMIPATTRIIRKRVGAVSDEAFVGLGLAMAVLGNLQLMQQKQTEINRARAEAESGRTAPALAVQ